MSKLGLKDKSFLSPTDTTTDTMSTKSSNQPRSSSDLGQRFKLNAFLEECRIKPIERPWLDWEEASERTRERYFERSAEIISTLLQVVYPGAAMKLWEELQNSTVINNLLKANSTDLGKLATTNAYLEALAEAYKNATSWDRRRQVLSIMAGVASFLEISEYIPGLTRYRYTAANLHRKQYGRAAPVPKKDAPRLRIDRLQLDHFLCFITSPHLVQDLPYGQTNLKLSNGQVIQVPNVIRTMVPQRIVSQYKVYCEESKFAPMSDRSLLRILDECSASVRKSLQGLDNFAADGGKAFDDLLQLLDTLSSLNCSQGEVSKTREALKAGKLYLKGDYKVHISDDSQIADHCSVYATSDPTDKNLQKQCLHDHDKRCEQCDALDSTIRTIEVLIRGATYPSENDLEEAMFIYTSSSRAIFNWKCHQLRSVRQDQARHDILDQIDDKTVLIINDWAMKFIPQMYRESQSDWFGKRGISWHISVVYRRVNGELQWQAYIHIIQTCSQDSPAVVVIMEHILKTLKKEHPEIENAYFRQDNAGCYHSAITILSCPSISKASGINIQAVDFSDPQGGKGAADRLAATAKSHIRLFINEGHDVTTAEEMKDALLSHGSITGVRVVAVDRVYEDSPISDKIPGISLLNNYQFIDDKILAWKAYGIGSGKEVMKKLPSDYDYHWIDEEFSPGDFKSMSVRRKEPKSLPCPVDQPQPLEESLSPNLYSCPQDGCVKVFQRYANLERHLSLEKCEKRVERQSLMDLAKSEYAIRLQEGVGVIPSLKCITSDQEVGSTRQILHQGWSLKKTAKSYRFSEKQVCYLKSKFNIGVTSGHKVSPEIVAKEMRRCVGQDGQRMFNSREFLTSQQIKSFFSREAAKQRKLSEADVNAQQEEANFVNAQQAVLLSLNICHPIMYDKYDMCSIVKNGTLSSLKLPVLQAMCEHFDLHVEVPKDKRKKEPHVRLLVKMVETCQC